jgi:hypothetical protein
MDLLLKLIKYFVNYVKSVLKHSPRDILILSNGNYRDLTNMATFLRGTTT